MEKQKKAYVHAAGAVLLWATVASAFKITLRYLDPIQLVFYSSAVSSVTLLAVLLLQRKVGLLRRYSPGDYLRSALLGLLNPFLYYVVLFKAYELLPAQQAQPINMTWPIVLVLLSIPVLRQRIGPLSIAAILVSFSGVYILSTKGDVLGMRFTSAPGVALALVSTVFWALFWVLNVRDRRDAVAKLFLSFTFGAVFSLILALATTDLLNIRPEGFLGAFYVGIFEMGITFVVWLKALKLSRTTAQVSNLIYISPFLSLIPIHFIVGETIHISSVIGLVFIVAGVLVQQYDSRRRAKSRGAADSV